MEVCGLQVLPAVRSMTWENWVMQGFERMDRQLADVGALAGYKAWSTGPPAV